MPLSGGMSTVGLGINFVANDLASGTMGVLGSNFNKLSQGITSGAGRITAGFGAVVAGASAMAIGIGTARQAWDFAETAGGFERQMAAVRTISRASADEFDNLSEAAIRAGLATKFSPEEAAGGLRTLSQAGLMANDAITALVPTLDFATAGQVEVAEAAEIGMGVMNAYGMQVDQLPMVYDRLMRATQMSQLGADEFLTVMGRAASTGNLFKQQLDEVMIALASVRSQGIPATVATTAVGEAFRRLGADQETQRLVQQRGVRVFDEQTGRFRDFTTVMREYGQAISHLSDAEQTRLVAQAFQVRGMATFNAITNMQAAVMENGTRRVLRGAEAHAYYQQQLRESAGTTAEFRDRDLATFAGTMDILRGTMETLSTTIGMTFVDIFGPAIQGVTFLVQRLIAAWRALPESARSVIGSATLIGSVLMTIFGAASIIIGIFIFLGSTVTAVMGTILAVAGPVAIAFAGIIAVIAGLITIGYALYQAYEQNLGGLRDSVNDFLSTLQLAWRGVTAIFSGEGVVGGLRGEMIAAGGALLPFMDAIQNLWNRVQAVWTGIKEGFNSVWTAMGPTIEMLKTAFSELGSALAELFSTFLGNANNLPEDKFQSIGQTIGVFLAGGLETVINLITVLVRAIAIVAKVFSIAFKIVSPFIRIAQHLFANLIIVMKTVYDFILKIVRGIAWLGDKLNILNVGRGLFNVLEGARARPATPEEVQQTRREESRQRSEPALERPAVAETQARRGGDGGGIEIAQAIRESNRRRTPINMQMDVNLDGSQMQSVMRTAEVDGQSLDGGLPVSEWTDF